MNITNAKPKRNAHVAFRVLVLGDAPVRVAEDEGLSLPRMNQILKQFALQVLGVPMEASHPIRVLKEFVQANCIRNNELVPWRPRA